MTAMTRKFLRVNLSNGKVEEESIEEQVAIDFIGGSGFGISYLYKELAPDTDPLGEDNKLLMITGPLAGTSAQAVSRWMVCTRSPLTGAFARSVCGADFGAWIKFAGYDFIMIEGKAEKPVYIHLTENGCEVKPADELWGKDTLKTQEWLIDRYGKNTRVACIGPAGENLVKYSSITSARRTASRCGGGTVMGSKNLKAVAITVKRDVRLHDADTFKQLAKEQVKSMLSNKFYQHHKEVGTTTTHDLTNTLGIYPVRNFRYGQQTDYEKLSGDEYRKFRTGDFSCYSCSVKCGKKHHVTSGPYAGADSEGPEYETIWAFSGPMDNTNIEATIAADQLCDDLGLDTISTGNTIGFAYELYEKGLLTKQDTDGLELTWGNHSAMIELIKKIARREGIGNLLAEGTMRVAASIGKGSEVYAIHVKGLELPAYEPRGAKCLGFNYATSNIGGSHGYGYAPQEVFSSPIPRQVDRFAEEENADIVIFNQNGRAMRELGIVCSFAGMMGWLPELYGKMLIAATGIEQIAEPGYLQKVGERIVNLERAFNVRNGFGRKHDTLPQRFLEEPLQTKGAPGEGQMIRSLDKFLDRYYQMRGWTPDGVPSPQKLNELGLGDMVKDLV
ncbi:aldehyde ferredoxin oxidoreductase family protein [Thermodesulfobacteriota bacterium]